MLARLFLFCGQIFILPQLFCSAVVFLIWRGFFCFAVNFLFCSYFFVLPWLFGFAVRLMGHHKKAVMIKIKHKGGYDTLNSPSKNMIHQTIPVD